MIRKKEEEDLPEFRKVGMQQFKDYKNIQKITKRGQSQQPITAITMEIT